MKLMNNITGKYQALPEEMLSKRISVIYSVHIVKRPISLPFYIPQLVKFLPFYIPEAWKRHPFRAEPPRIGRYREYPPPGLRTLEKCRKHSPAARAFYIPLVFSNACRVLSQCNTRLRLLCLLNITQHRQGICCLTWGYDEEYIIFISVRNIKPVQPPPPPPVKGAVPLFNPSEIHLDKKDALLAEEKYSSSAPEGNPFRKAANGKGYLVVRHAVIAFYYWQMLKIQWE